MFGFWFLGFVSFVVYRIFNAGMNSKTLFYTPPGRYDNGPSFSEDRVAAYCVKTIASGFLWPIVLPTVGIYKLGQRFNKDAK